jgi:hypothetical protein
MSVFRVFCVFILSLCFKETPCCSCKYNKLNIFVLVFVCWEMYFRQTELRLQDYSYIISQSLFTVLHRRNIKSCKIFQNLKACNWAGYVSNINSNFLIIFSIVNMDLVTHNYNSVEKSDKLQNFNGSIHLIIFSGKPGTLLCHLFWYPVKMYRTALGLTGHKLSVQIHSFPSPAILN